MPEKPARRPRIVLATDSRDPSGLGEHMLALARGLSADHEVILLADPASAGPFLARAARLRLAVKDMPLDEDLAAWLQRANIDLLHVHAGIGWEGHALAAAGIASGIPVIRTEHLPYLLTDAAQQTQYRTETSRLSHHIVVSEASRKTYACGHVDPSRLTVVRNGIFPLEPAAAPDQTRAALGLSGRTVLLSVARFSAQKDHASLIRAMPAILRQHPSAMLLLVGSGEERQRVEALAAETGVAGSVCFLGQRDDVADLMAIADLFVLSSLFEGLPLAVLEAMSVGVPVVATRIGGTVEALGDEHPYFAEPGQPASLAEAIIGALDDPAGRAAIGEAGRAQFRRHFSAARMASETASVYRPFIALNSSLTKDRSMQKTRLGFIGVGGIAHRHLDILATFEDVELVAFADPDAARADAAARRFGATSFTSHRDMLESATVDAVYICVPPFAHGEPERDLIAKEIPFFVEKPVSLDIALAEEIAAGVAEKNLVTAVGYHWRYLDTVEEARALLADNPAQLLSGYWLDSTPPPQWWWKEDKSGGQMVEQTTHLLDLARFLIGEVTEVYGRAGHAERQDFPGLDVPTVSTASLTFQSGVVANIASTCLLGWSHRVGLHIFADKLAIELTDRDIMVDVGRGRPVRQADGDPVWREDRDFIDAVRGSENRIRCPYADAVATHRLALAVVASSRSGEAVHLDLPALTRAPLAPLQFQPRPEEAPRGMPPGHRKIRSLGIEGPGRAYVFEYEEGPPADGQVRLETLYTGLSAGTELTFLKNTNPYFRSRFDAGRGVFIENEPDLHYPVPFLGYMEVARVSESRTGGYAEGDVIATTYAHKTGHTADPYHDVLVPMPAEVDPLLGVFVAQMGPIAANGILHADAEAMGTQVAALGAGVAGRPVLVIGAGTVGLMTALFARKLGASDVVITDPSDFRRAKAEAMGLTAMTEDQAWQHAKARWHDGGLGRGADLVFQTRAHSGSLQTALKALRPQGTVIDLAFYQGGADALRLGEEFHHNGLNIRCAQINRVPRGLSAIWNRQRLARETVDLLRHDGATIREHMVTHVVPFEDGPAFLQDLVKHRPDFLQVVFKVGA
ncbi:glycosyl transferase family 1 [Rhizobium sp. Leaf384]|uniref:glycosyltransferase n=1 Tax=unclassified Rhizobium TaxID=2613769 RepID=UPI0007155649|nr:MULTISPECIES: glycosyltransferase [unclassified Rhizobium]KQS76635.1 glycosyl transferase family 1 [Rhizobium sp. Leaf383]KQS77903.1 glycosyl transferase family 1 [Rhizobium sp. Leaf384]